MSQIGARGACLRITVSLGPRTFHATKGAVNLPDSEDEWKEQVQLSYEETWRRARGTAPNGRMTTREYVGCFAYLCCCGWVCD
jgi:hypothetical protein